MTARREPTLLPLLGRDTAERPYSPGISRHATGRGPRAARHPSLRQAIHIASEDREARERFGGNDRISAAIFNRLAWATRPDGARAAGHNDRSAEESGSGIVAKSRPKTRSPCIDVQTEHIARAKLSHNAGSHDDEGYRDKAIIKVAYFTSAAVRF
jgi:hypothetical protein